MKAVTYAYPPRHEENTEEEEDTFDLTSLMLYPVAVKIVLQTAIGFLFRVVRDMDWYKRVKPLETLKAKHLSFNC